MNNQNRQLQDSKAWKDFDKVFKSLFGDPKAIPPLNPGNWWTKLLCSWDIHKTALRPASFLETNDLFIEYCPCCGETLDSF